MMMLSSPGGPRRPRLRSPKSLREISSSREVSGASSSSSEVRSATENLLEGSPCSCVGDDDPWDEPSGKEVGGGEDVVGDDGGVETSLNEDKDTLT
jgi:hypothetical protein